jgi:hypothetical protein
MTVKFTTVWRCPLRPANRPCEAELPEVRRCCNVLLQDLPAVRGARLADLELDVRKR